MKAIIFRLQIIVVVSLLLTSCTNQQEVVIGNSEVIEEDPGEQKFETVPHCDRNGLIESGHHRGDVRAPDRADQHQRSSIAAVEEQQVRQCGIDEGQDEEARILVDRDTAAVGEIERGNRRNAEPPSCKCMTELVDERLHHVGQRVEEGRVQRPQRQCGSD